MIYKVEFTKGARKLFRKLSQELQDRIQSKIDDLAIEPYMLLHIKLVLE